jgi:asparagine synthase (glutamine-hydrolysing)
MRSAARSVQIAARDLYYCLSGGPTRAEVFVHLHEEAGTAWIKELDGILGFAILDLRRDLLFLARDPIRVKALFYAATTDHFLFGSEIKALLASSNVTSAPDWQAISDIY